MPVSTKTTRETRRERRKQQQRRQITRNLLIVGGVVLLFAAVLIYASLRPIGDIVEITPRSLPNVNGRQMGNPDAPVVMEVFEDFQCPVCRQFTDEVEPILIENYISTGKVLFVLRFNPFLDDRSSSNESDQAANASLCANEQGYFWEYHDMLFANQRGENIGAFSNRRLQAFAETLGLDMSAFNACFSANKYQDEILQDLALVRERFVTGTPTVFINGKVLPNFSYTTIQNAIEEALTALP
jgi:protein-disulfide isomerase